MRALVAEANAVTRVTLTRILERSGFAVDDLRDELAATCLIHQPDAPVLVLLALDTVLVDFDRVCRAMRTVRPDVFIVGLVPENRRADLLYVLHDGADDFILKPIAVQEAEARILVLRRHLAERMENRARAGRHADDVPLRTTEGHPAGEERQPTPDLPDDEAATRLDEEARAPAPGGLQPFAMLDLPAVLSAVFDELGLGPATVMAAEAVTEAPDYAAWAPLVLLRHDEAFWINVRLDLGRASTQHLRTAINKKAGPAESTALQLLQSVMARLQASLADALREHGGADVLPPLSPHAFHAERLPSLAAMSSRRAERVHLGLSLPGGLNVRFTATSDGLRSLDRLVTSLRPMDVLAAPIETAEHQRLLRAGTMLTDDYVGKILSFVLTHHVSKRVTIYRPPSGTAVFLDNLAHGL